MDTQQRRRQLNRQRNGHGAKVTAHYGSRQICIPMDRETYDDIWRDSTKVRSLLETMIAVHPEIFPAGIEEGFTLTGSLPGSQKLPGICLRQIRIQGIAYTLRPSFVMPYFTGITEEFEKPLLLLSYGVPCWLVTQLFGHNDMFWYRQVERLGRNSLVGTTICVADSLPQHLAADEHHAHWRPEGLHCNDRFPGLFAWRGFDGRGRPGSFAGSLWRFRGRSA